MTKQPLSKGSESKATFQPWNRVRTLSARDSDNWVFARPAGMGAKALTTAKEAKRTAKTFMVDSESFSKNEKFMTYALVLTASCCRENPLRRSWVRGSCRTNRSMESEQRNIGIESIFPQFQVAPSVKTIRKKKFTWLSIIKVLESEFCTFPKLRYLDFSFYLRPYVLSKTWYFFSYGRRARLFYDFSSVRYRIPVCFVIAGDKKKENGPSFVRFSSWPSSRARNWRRLFFWGKMVNFTFSLKHGFLTTLALVLHIFSRCDDSFQRNHLN